MIRLTDRAHAALAEVIRPGDTVIDATVGNGHDTLFLARCVGPTGIVAGFDCQSLALRQTAGRLSESGLPDAVLYQQDHATMASVLPADWRGQVSAIVFNLGYLPGGDKQITTHADSTIVALRAALDLLKPGGLLSILAYPGHPAGAVETAAVEHFCRELSSTKFTWIEPVAAVSTHAPRLFLVSKRR